MGKIWQRRTQFPCCQNVSQEIENEICMNAPQKSGMYYSLFIGRHQIVFLIREIDVARSKRAQYIFYEFKGRRLNHDV